MLSPAGPGWSRSARRAGEFRVWTKRVGTNPDLKVLLLHGGPGAPASSTSASTPGSRGPGIEYYYYDQLGSFRSDQPDDPSLWELARFVDEVEQVRQALGLDRSNFVLLGQSWGGLLAMEYAVLLSAAPQGAGDLQHDVQRAAVQRLRQRRPDASHGPGACWRRSSSSRPRARPATRATSSCSWSITTSSTSAACRSGNGRTRSPGRSATSTRRSTCPCRDPASSGSAARWRTGTGRRICRRIDVPALVIGATHDTMDPGHMRWMSEQLPQGRYLHCPDGSHLAQFDDPGHYFPGLIDFLESL